VVIDMDFSGILWTLQSMRHDLPDLKLYMTNQEGDFLLHPDPALAFGYVFGQRSRIQATYPDVARLFEPGNTEAVAVVRDVSQEAGQLLHFSKVFFDPADPRRFLGLALAASYRDVLAESIEVGHRSAVLTLFLGVAAGTLAFIFSRVLTQPIRQLTVAAQQVAQGDYDVHLPVGAPDEVGVLARSVRRMIDQVQERGQALEHKANELERVNQELQQFVYVVSHDLKAPLRAVSNLSTWLEEDAAARLNPEEREHLALLRARVQRMDEFIEALLAYSRAGRSTREPEVVDSGALVHEIVTMLALPGGFTVEVAPDMPRFITDRLHLGQVFSNLIANAVKHHDRTDGHVRVACRAVPGRRFEFSVADDGPGIPREYQANIFQVFQTLKARDEGGSTGIGLSIVKKVVETYNGKVWVESEPGQGATFRFTWPKTIES
jgi:signal transduction histidine kinase